MPGSEPSTALTYSAEFQDGANRFREFEKRFQDGTLCAWRDIPQGRLLYRYHDGAVFLNDKGIQDRRGALIALFGLTNTIKQDVQKRFQRLFFGRIVWNSIGYEEVDVLGAKPGTGIVVKFGDQWVEASKILKSKLVRDNGIPFSEDRPASTMATPGYEPMIRSTIEFIAPGPSKTVSKYTSLDGEATIWVRPSNLRIFMRSRHKIPKIGKLKRHGKWRQYSQIFKMQRVRGPVEPLGAMCAAQLPKLIGI